MAVGPLDKNSPDPYRLCVQRSMDIMYTAAYNRRNQQTLCLLRHNNVRFCAVDNPALQWKVGGTVKQDEETKP